jgi:hypothetical protein
MNPTYESMNPMHFPHAAASAARAAAAPAVSINLFDEMTLELDISPEEERLHQSRIEEFRLTIENCPRPQQTHRSRHMIRLPGAPRRPMPFLSQCEPAIHAHKCRACHNHGHELKNCTDPLIVGQFEQDKLIFHRLLTNRLRELEFISLAFCSFAVEIHKTPKHVLKYLIMKNGGRTRRVNKARLSAKYMSILFDDFIQVSCDDGSMSEDSYKYELLEAEQNYWLNISNGVTMEYASEIYNALLNRIMLNATIRDTAIMNNLTSLPIVPLIETMDVQMMPIEKLNFEDDFECCICFETLNELDSVELNCAHSFCGVCVSKTIKTCEKNHTRPNCALCRSEYTQLKLKTEYVRNLLYKK